MSVNKPLPWMVVVVWSFGMLFGGVAAEAAVPRAFVSTSGTDANTSSNCGPTAPCRTFGAAVSVLAPGGEIVVLTSGGYGPVTITQSLSIRATGIYAGITVASGNGVTINAPGGNVLITGLTINGSGGTTGVAIQSASAVVLDSCTISNMSGDGIADSRSTPPNSNGYPQQHLEVTSSQIHDNGGMGIAIAPAGEGNFVAIQDSQLVNNLGGGIGVSDGAFVGVYGTRVYAVATQGPGIGVRVSGTSGPFQ